MKARILILAAAIGLLFVTTPFARAQGTAFTYQGQLNVSGVAAAGSFDLRFGLYTNLVTTNIVGSLVTNSATAVSNGLFTTTLNFGNVFNGTSYWLEIGVRSNGSGGGFTTLSPRQPITPAPYAITASNLLGTLSATQLTGMLPASSLTGTYSNAVTFTNATNVFAGNGSGLVGLPGQTNYLFATDTNSQGILSAGVFQGVAFNTIAYNGGWNYSGGVFTAPQAGLYQVQYQILFQNQTSSTLISAEARAIVSPSLEPLGSESIIGIYPGTIGELSRSFLLQMTAGQGLAIEITATQPYPYISTYSTPFSGAFYPDATLTITRVQ